MTASHAAMLVVGALLLIAPIYVRGIRSNRRQHRLLERLRLGRTESVMADHEGNLQ